MRMQPTKTDHARTPKKATIDGNCLNDQDGDGVCDEFKLLSGRNACNYNADATDATILYVR